VLSIYTPQSLFTGSVVLMKPLVLLAQSRELSAYIKSVDELDQASLIEIHKKLLKMQTEVSENLERL